MHPYRSAPPPAEEPRAGSFGEEWMLAVLLAVLGVARVTIALVRQEDMAADVTIAAILGAIGLVLLAQLTVRAIRARS